MAIKVTTRKTGSGFTCPRCKQWNPLGVYWAAHQDTTLEGPCGNKACGETFTIMGRKIEKSTPSTMAPAPGAP